MTPCYAPDPEQQARLACRSLTAGYGVRSVLSGITLSIYPGEITAIIGPNGSGKSTLLHCLSGLMTPASGVVELDNKALKQFTPKTRARRIAVLPQRLSPMPGLSALDLALLGRYPHVGKLGFFSRADHTAAWEALEKLQLGHLAHRPLDALSGGELQRVFLARALAQQADILLLDEPAGALDPARTSELFILLHALAHSGACVVAVLHDVNAAALYCRRVLALKQGNLAFDVPATALTAPLLSDLYGTAFHSLSHPVSKSPQFCLAAPNLTPDGV